MNYIGLLRNILSFSPILRDDDDWTDVFIPVTPGTGEVSDTNTNSTDFSGGFNNILERYRVLILGVFGLITMTLIILFIYYFVELGHSGDNPQDRSRAIKNILWCGIATALMGSITVVFGLSFFALH